MRREIFAGDVWVIVELGELGVGGARIGVASLRHGVDQQAHDGDEADAGQDHRLRRPTAPRPLRGCAIAPPPPALGIARLTGGPLIAAL